MFYRLAFLIFSFFAMYSSGALALECERYKLAQTGFTTPAAAESWYPKFMSFNNSDFEPKGGSSKNMIFIDERFGNTAIKHTLMKNGKLISRLDFEAGYQDPDDSRYKCDMTSIELKEANASSLSSDNKSTKSSEASTSPTSSSSNLSKIDKAKSICTELGFKAGTEKHGECVLKLIDF